MDAIRTSKRTLRADQRGATAIEYGLIVSLVVIGMMVGLVNLGSATSAQWWRINNAVANSCANC